MVEQGYCLLAGASLPSDLGGLSPDVFNQELDVIRLWTAHMLCTGDDDMLVSGRLADLAVSTDFTVGIEAMEEVD